MFIRYLFVYFSLSFFSNLAISQAELDKKHINNSLVTLSLSYEDASVRHPFGFTPKDAAILKLLKAKEYGLGFIIQKGGKKYIITDAHVIDGIHSKNAQLIAHAKRENTIKNYEVTIIGGDTQYDIAVLSFKNQADYQDFEWLEFTDTPLQAGKEIIAVGSNLIEEQFQRGKLDKKLDLIANKAFGWFQFWETTAAIFKGFSGGPILDNNGKIAGISSFIAQDNKSYILDSSFAKAAIEEIIQNNGRVKRMFLGLEIADFGDGIPIINDIIPGVITDLDKEKLKNGRLKSINGVNVTSIHQALLIMEDIAPNSLVKIQYEKNGEDKYFEVKSGTLTIQALEKIACHFIEKKTDFLNLDEQDNTTYFGKDTLTAIGIEVSGKEYLYHISIYGGKIHYQKNYKQPAPRKYLLGKEYPLGKLLYY